MARRLTNIENRANIGMIERRSGACLALKTAERPWFLRDFLRQTLESHEPVQPDVLDLVDHAHSAAAQLLDDAVMRDRLAAEETGGRCRVLAPRRISVLLKTDGSRRHFYRRALQETSASRCDASRERTSRSSTACSRLLTRFHRSESITCAAGE